MLAALRDENDDVRNSAAEALGEVKVGAPEVVSGLLVALQDENEHVRNSVAEGLGNIGDAPEVVSGLLVALRDENEHVRSWAAGALAEVSKDHKSKLPQELNHQVAGTLRDMLDDPRNQESKFFFFGGRVYTKSVDVIWEALWLMCKRMDEQRS